MPVSVETLANGEECVFRDPQSDSVVKVLHFSESLTLQKFSKVVDHEDDDEEDLPFSFDTIIDNVRYKLDFSFPISPVAAKGIVDTIKELKKHRKKKLFTDVELLESSYSYEVALIGRSALNIVFWDSEYGNVPMTDAEILFNVWVRGKNKLEDFLAALSS